MANLPESCDAFSHDPTLDHSDRPGMRFCGPCGWEYSTHLPWDDGNTGTTDDGPYTMPDEDGDRS